MEKLKQIGLALKTRRWLQVIVAVVVLLVLWLAFSTRVLVGMANKNTDFVRVRAEEPLGEYRVAGALDSFAVDTDLMQTVRLFGWVYCMSPADDDASTAHLLAVSDKATYKLTPGRNFRDDLYKLFASDTVGTKKFSGITGEFSPMGMKDGRYRLHYQVEENGAIAGTEVSDYFIVKENGQVSMFRWEGTRQEPVEVAGDANRLLGELNWVGEDEDGKLQVEGWAFIDSEEIAGQQVYLEVADTEGNTALYDTLRDRNAYVANSVIGESYAETGFSTTIGDFEGTPASMRILLESGGVYYPGESVALGKNADDEWVFTRSETVEPAVQPDDVKPEDAAPSRAFYSALDQIVREDDGSLNFYGWAFAEGISTAEQEVYLAITDGAGKETVWSTRPYTRPDLALASGVQYAHSGFKCIAPAVEDPAEVQLLIRQKGGALLASPRYTLRLDEAGGTAVALSGEVPAEGSISDGGEALQYGLDRAERTPEGDVVVVGWTYLDQEGYLPAETAVYVEVTDKAGKVTLYDTQARRRDDVATALGKPEMAGAGFEAMITGQTEAVVSLRIVVPDGTGALVATAPLEVDIP